jgi:hypothetical protein
MLLLLMMMLMMMMMLKTPFVDMMTTDVAVRYDLAM